MENNQSFPIHMPVRVRNVTPAEKSQITPLSTSAQMLGNDAIFIADVPANTHKTISFAGGTLTEPSLAVKPMSNGVDLVYSGVELGRLSWGLLVTPVKAKDETTEHFDFNAAFGPLPLSFQRTGHGPVFDVWSAETVKAGLKLKFELLAHADGFLDINASLTNESANAQAKVYAAVVARWDQPRVKARTLCYDDRISPLGGRAFSPFRSGEGRHQFTQRGADWVRAVFPGITAAWLNDFAPSFTVLDNSSKNSFKQPRYEGANLPQLGQEVQTFGESFYSITEIARSNTRSYRDRLAENVLPAQGDGVTFSSRIVFARAALSDKAVDDIFVGWTSYNEQRQATEGTVLAFGAPSVKFGTSYFPYSTLGENFDDLKLPGMDRDSFWPLAADTVLHWREFADQIRTDLRIAKFMGFQFIRLHHLELLAAIPNPQRQEYLDFIFGELRHLKLKAFVDIYASDTAIVELLQRYGDTIDSVEIENETLIWGIPLDRPAEWKQTYEAIKKVAPNVRVNFTGYNNTGMFNRLAALGVPFDRVGFHSYIDSLDAIPTSRGYALALGSFCSKIGKPPVVTEFNWRQLTRLTPEARAKIYAPIFENALATRAIPEMYEFQFNETLAPNPRLGRGNVLRHYELINLSRRPKPEALELGKLITKYTDPNDALRRLDAPYVTVNLDSSGKTRATAQIKNTSKHPEHLVVTVESPEGLNASLVDSGKLELEPGQTKSLAVALKATANTPGFYHTFLRFEGDGLLRYGWIEARLKGKPKLDLESKSAVEYAPNVADALKLDFFQPLAVVYGENATVLEVETAFAIASTLESAIGQPVDAIQFPDLPEATRRDGNVIWVVTAKSEKILTQFEGKLIAPKSGSVTRIGSNVVVFGEDSRAAEQAGMDLSLRWWRSAKDSAARRVGLVKKELPRGGDASKLP